MQNTTMADFVKMVQYYLVTEKEWLEDFCSQLSPTSDHFYKFSGDGRAALQSSAKIEVYKYVIRMAPHFGDDLDKLKEHLNEMLITLAASDSSSTDPVSNLLEKYRLQAYALLVKPRLW